MLGLTVLVLLALQILAHGALLLALHEWRASLAGLHVLQARAAAEAGARRPLADGFPEAWVGTPALGVVAMGSSMLGPHRSGTVLRRLGREAWLSVGEGSAAGQNWTWRSARLLWLVDPVARAAEDPSTLRVGPEGGVGGTGRVEGGTFFASAAPSWCGPWAAALDSLLRGREAAAVGSSGGSGAAGPRLGALGPEALSSLLPAGPGVAGTPGPSLRLGRCDLEDPWNWGDPLDPGGACGGVQVARVFPGGLALRGGRGQGLLVVLGDLDVAETYFQGLVLVAGDLRLREGARLEGQVTVQGTTRLEEGTRLSPSACAVARAVDEARRWLGAPVPLAGTGLMDLP